MLKSKLIALSEVRPTETSHHCGQKRVLIGNDDTASDITQIAITTMAKGETSGKHVHPTMEEYFLVRKGRLRIDCGEDVFIANADDFISIPANMPHNVTALTNVEMMTIGCALHEKCTPIE